MGVAASREEYEAAKCAVDEATEALRTAEMRLLTVERNMKRIDELKRVIPPEKSRGPTSHVRRRKTRVVHSHVEGVPVSCPQTTSAMEG